MNELQTQSNSPSQDVALATAHLRGSHKMDVQFTPLDELRHSLRQPLEVIETLAYYLEMTSRDERLCSHLQKIQAMVLKANEILTHAA